MPSENQPAMWMTAPWHQYHMTSVPAQCLCFQSSAVNTPVERQSSDPCMLTSNSVRCENPGHRVLGFIPSIALSGQLQLPPNSVCTCFSGGNDCQKAVSSFRCLCSSSQQLHVINGGLSVGGSCSGVPPLSGPAVQQSVFSSVRCDEKLKAQSQQCGPLSSRENTSETEYDRTQVSKQEKEDGQLLCLCSKRLASQGSCCLKSSSEQSFSQKCTCSKCVFAERQQDRYGRDNALVANCGPHKIHPIYKENSNLQSTDDGCADVFKWQRWHLQQLAVQKSQVLGRQMELESVNVSVEKQMKDQPNSGDATSKNDSIYHENILADTDKPINNEQIEAMARQIAELQCELKQERMKAMLYQVLFKQSQDELDSLRNGVVAKTEMSTARDTGWESYCRADEANETEIDNVSSLVLESSSTTDRKECDISLHSCKWQCNSTSLTDEGVGSELNSVDQTSRFCEAAFTPASQDDVLARNNYNIRSLRQTLKELSRCYDELLEENLSLTRQLKELTRKCGREHQLMKELQTSYVLLKTVLDLWIGVSNKTGVPSTSEKHHSESMGYSSKSTSAKLMLRDVTALRRNIEELNRVALQRLVVARYQQAAAV